MNKIDREKCEKQYIESIKEKMKLFIQKGLLNPIEEYQTVHNWIQQFSDNSIVPYLLLDTLVILTKDQVEASLKNVLEQIKTSIYVNNPTLSDTELFSLLDDHMEHSAFISACNPGETAGGAPETLRALRKVIGGKKFTEIAVFDICKGISDGKIRNVYVVDDFIGTGKTICKFMKSEHLCENCVCGKEIGKCSIICAMKNNPDVRFNIISVVLHGEGAKHITDEFKGVTLLSSFNIDGAYDLLSETCELYRDPNYIKETIDVVTNIIKEHHMDDNEYALHLPIGISDAFPNNSLEVFWWAESPKWKPLAPRQH